MYVSFLWSESDDDVISFVKFRMGVFDLVSVKSKFDIFQEDGSGSLLKVSLGF